MFENSLEFFQKTQIVVSSAMGFVIVVIAIFQFNISNKQKRIAHQKLKLDLFEKRFQILQCMRDFISHVISTGGADQTEVRKLHLSVYGGEFLFDRELSDYISDFLERSRKLSAATHVLQGQIDPGDRAKFANEMGTQLGWFVQQYNEIGAKFRPYLHMSETA